MPRKLIFGVLLAIGVVSGLPAEDVGTIPDAIPPVYALKGVTVVVGTGETMSNATVVIRDGLIEAVGPGVSVPPEAWEVDASGMFVYPGLVDAFTTNGYRKSAPSRGQQAQGGRGRGGQARPAPSEEGPGYFAHRSAADNLDTDDKKLESWRQAGILTFNVAPDNGIFRGTSAVINLNGRDADHMIVDDDVAMNVAFETQGFTNYPGSLMGVIAHIRQTLYDARHYRIAWEEYNKNKRGMRRPETDRTLEALIPALDGGGLPLVFPAKRAREIRRSLALCAESKAQCIIAGGFEADQVAQELREQQVPVLVSLNYPKKPRDPHPEDQESVSELRYRIQAPAAAGKLAAAGVKFAFYSDGASANDFLPNLRKAVKRGLSKDAAVQAATLSAAEILGVGEQLGSVEAGKIANLIVADGDLMDDGTQIQKVFVDGTMYKVPSKPKKPESKGEATGSLTGQWSIEVQAPGQTFNMTLDAIHDGGGVTGTVSTDEGTLEIYDGSVEGSNFSVKFEVDFGMGPQEVTLSGTITGDSLTGSATVAGMGSAPMTGKKVPR